jgi:hypothetical protein
MKLSFLSGWAALLLSAASLLGNDSLRLTFEGDAAKDSSQGRAVELENVVIMQAGSKAYADLDGKGALVIPSDPGLVFRSNDTFWLTALINPQARGKSNPIVSKAGNYRVALQPDGKPLFTYYSKGAWRSLVSEEPLELNTWQQIAVYFDSPSGLATLFIDGKVAATSQTQEPFQSADDTPLYIGGVPVPEKDTFVGFLGYIGAVTIDRSAPQDFPATLEVGTKAFDVPPAF